MSDSDEKNVRRLGRQDRKDRLPAADSLFPPDDSPEQTDTPSAELDLDNLGLPDSDQDALESLAALGQDAVRPPVITPEEERYPPIAPDRMAQSETQATRAEPRKRSNRLYNLITGLALLGTVAALGWLALVWINPQSVLNPLPPSTPFVQVTATMPGADFTPTPNEAGQIVIVATDAPAATTAATQSPYAFVLANPVMHVPNANDLGCNWWSIAGTVTDRNNAALNGYRVRVVGEDVDETVFSGAALTFGPGGFELPLIGTPQEAEFTVQLFSPQDAPLSEPIPVTTRADCEGNVALVNFVQNR